ncbi:MAG: hypothetical protein CVV30_03945 [Methanomicrobiales archaeon HGW-Methanomicrobiales-1]|jgi:hypothetical protein|nr:MAG: hypothetical protein CVV30_03945 [Methanomicrobiales archaeon HGW-Methanomicrobiales-1]
MKRISGLVIVILVLLFAAVLIAGCTDSTPATTPSVQPSPTTTPETTALYIAGDIVSPKSGAETGWLILKYDSGTDSYERAFIYRNTDGSWGYRVNALTETLTRPILEKVNAVKVTHVDPSQVPLKQPAVTTSIMTAAITPSTGTATTPAVTATTSTIAPKIKGIAPENGYVGTSVSITDILGDGFQSGATVKLVRSDGSNISATNVNVFSPAHISCTFSLPSDAVIGVWDIIVSNPDGQSSRYSNGFTVRVNPSVTATTTTSSTGGIDITSINPASTYSNYPAVTIFGSNFKNNIACKLTRSGNADITASYVSRTSETQMQCYFPIPTGSFGTWNLVLTNTDGTTGTLTNSFSINI